MSDGPLYYIDIDLNKCEIPDINGVVIPAGTMFIVEHGCESLPENTLVLVGQSLPRDLYPELSPVYSSSGGFYDFTVENLLKRFILGFDQNGEIIYGDGAIYYRSVPVNE